MPICGAFVALSSRCCVAVQAFAVMLQYDDTLAEQSEVFLQFALLYSSTAGERRIR